MLKDREKRPKPIPEKEGLAKVSEGKWVSLEGPRQKREKGRSAQTP